MRTVIEKIGAGILIKDPEKIKGIKSSSREELRKAITDIFKQLCQGNTVKYLETRLAWILIPLDKQPGVRPNGIGEVLNYTVGKVIKRSLKRDVLKSPGTFPLCTGQDPGSEAAIYVIYEIFNKKICHYSLRGSIHVRCIKRLQCKILGAISS